MKKSIFALKITRDEKGLDFQTRADNFNNFEIVSILRAYCNELEKRLIGNRFKNMNMSIEKGDEK